MIVKGKITLEHAVISLSLLILAAIFGYLASTGPAGLESIFSSFAVAFVTSAFVDLLYNFVVMKDIEGMIVQKLMLNKEVQAEIINPDKINEIISTSLEYKVGKKLTEALQKSVINKIGADKDLFLMENPYCSIILNKSNDPNICKDYFELTFISIFNIIIKSNKAIFYATSDEELFYYLNNINDVETYHINKLPKIDPEILKANFAINELEIGGNIISKPIVSYPPLDELGLDDSIICESKLDDSEYFVIKVEFNLRPHIQIQKGEMVKVKFSLRSLVTKNRHLFFRGMTRAYPSLHVTWDCVNTDIKEVIPICAFLGAQPEIIRHLDKGEDNGKKIDILINDWVLPDNLIAFVWSLNGEWNDRANVHIQN